MKNSGFIVKSCKVKARITDNEDEAGITKISLKIEKNQNVDENKNNDEDNVEELENKMISEIQKIKKVDINITKNAPNNEDSKLENSDIQNLKKFLIKEYEVNEKCLEIN